MNPIVLLIADGNAFFLGMVMVLITLVLRSWMHHSLVLMVMRIIGIIGVASIVASSTPFPLWVYGIWCSLWLVTFLFPVNRTKRIITPLFLLLSFFLCLLELPHHFAQRIPVSPNQHVYVLGDSISAGMGTSERNWPVVLGDISHLAVSNLSQPGATASSAVRQTKGIVQSNSLVLIEIGGNDMIGDTPSDEFSKDLDLLLQRIPSSNRVVMFELPLLPFHSDYGRVQRVLARKHNVLLIPKECLTHVIGIADDTLDGLHLSQKGHDALAKSVFNMLTITR